MAQRRVSKTEIRESLENSRHPLTINQLADRHGISGDTVRKNIKRLRREDNVPVVFNQNGNYILKTVETEEQAEDVRFMLDWSLATNAASMIVVVPMKKLIPGASRILREKFTPEERHQMSLCFAKARALIQAAEIDAEIE